MTSQESKRVVIVSGGSRGLGFALVQRMVSQGDIVATFSRKLSGELEKLLHSQGRENVLWHSVDSADGNAVREFVSSTYRRFGRIDCLINNAGVGSDGIFTSSLDRDIERCITINFIGTIALTKACAKHMLVQGSGSIINISSVNAVRGHSGVAVYSGTKAALDGLTRSLARELGPAGVRVNSVAPGYFDSDMVEDLTDAQRARIVRRTPLGRLASVEDVGSVVHFLLSPAAGFITGQTIVVDGGITC